MNELTTTQTPRQMRLEIIRQGAPLEALEPAEKAVFMASSHREFGSMSDREIALLLSQMLPNIMKDSGYRQKEEDLQYLCGRLPALIKKRYGYLSVTDFVLAFDMSFVGELDAYLPKNSSGAAERWHYQSFSVEYISRILTAYACYRRSVMAKVEMAIPRKCQYTELDEKRNREKTRRRLSDAFRDYKTSRKKLQLSPISEMLFFDILVSMGLCEPIPDDNREQDAIMAATIPAGRYVTPKWLMERRAKRHAGIYAAFDELIKKNKTI